MKDASDVSLGGETVKSVLAKFSMALTGFIGTIIFARVLGPTDFGAYYLLFAAVKVADRPINGIATAAKKRFSETSADEGEIVGAQLLVIVCWIVAVSAAAFALSGLLREFTGLTDAAWVFVILMITVSVYEPMELLVQARGRVGAASWIDTVRSYLTLPLQVGFVLTGFGAAGMAYGLAVATGLIVPVAAYYVGVAPARPGHKTVTSLWGFARHSVVTSLVGKAYDRMDLLLLGTLVGAASAGHYEVAAKLSLPATFVATAAGSGLMARVSNLRTKGEGVTEDISNTLSFASIIAIPILFGAVALPRSIIVTLYGPEYRAAAPLLVGLALYRVLQTQSGPLTQTVDGIDRPEVNWKVSLVTLLVNVVVGIALIPLIGPVGVVVATVLAEAIRYVSLAWVVRGELREVQLFPETLREQIGAGAVMFIAVTALNHFIPVSSWVHLSALVGTGGVVYGVVLLVVSSRLRVTIGGILRGSGVERYVPDPVLRW